MKKGVRIAKGIVRGILIAFVGVFAVYSIYMLVARTVFHNRMPTFCGLALAVVATGSMEPEIAAGDVIVTLAQKQYAVGDVVTFYDEGRDEYVTHRIVSMEGDSVSTKGDANSGIDDAIAVSAIVGKVVAVWSGMGAFVGFLQSPLGALAVLGTGVLIWIAVELVTALITKKDEQVE